MLDWLKQALKAAPALTPASPRPDALQSAQANIRRGNQLLDQGRLQEAVTAYEAAVAIAPTADNLVNLGFALKECGRLDAARARLEQALCLEPRQFDAHYMLGVMTLAAGQPASAVRHLREALRLQPDSEVAALELCTACNLSGDPDGARAVAQAAAARHPQVAGFHFVLGNILTQDGAHAAAIDSFTRALGLRPDHPETLHNMGLALQSCGRLDEAAQALRQALASRPDYTPALYNLGAVLIALGEPAQAARHCAAAISLDAGDPDAHNVLGNACQAQGQLEAAAASYRQAIHLQATHAHAHNNLGMVLMAQGRLDDAGESFRQSLRLRPDDAGTLNNLGNLLQRQDRYTQAAATYREALKVDPCLANAWSNLAGALQAASDHEEAIATWRQALSLAPDFWSAWSNLLFGLSFLPSCTPQAYLAEARSFGAAVAARARPLSPVSRDPDAGSRRALRVGFLSGDLREHPVGFFLEGVLRHLAPEQVSLYAYSTSLSDDSLSERIRPRFAQWRSIAGQSDEAAAMAVRADGIDILIDLAGHTAGNRLPLFAWRPAAVQISWLGYFASTGMPGMDYLLADAVGVPAGNQAHFSESIRYLPGTRLCFTAPPDAQALPVGPLPALSNGHLTLGCFQNMTKLGEPTLALWGRVLAALPTARLLLQSRQMADPALRSRLLAALVRHGVAPQRVELQGPTSRRAYLAAHGQVDVMLDTFPFTGGTTTCEALWMGVPTVTLAGDTLLARQGASLLTAAGLGDWIALDADGYVARLEALDGDLPALAQLRAGLRAQVLASPLFDTAGFAAGLQATLLSIWREQA